MSRDGTRPIKMIKLQQQPSPTSCTQTCLAMLLNEPVTEVIALLGDSGMSELETHSALEKFHFVWNALVYPSMLWTGYYLVTTPSLNLPGRNHCVLLEIIDGDGIPIVYDPNEGREGKLFYRKGHRDISSWSQVVYVFQGGRLPNK